MKDNQIRKALNNDLYEILELNASEPIIFESTEEYQQPTYNEKNNQVILIVPREN